MAHLVVLEVHVAQKRVVLRDLRDELLNRWCVLVNLVPSGEAAREAHDLPEREMLPRRAVKSRRRLDELKRGAFSFVECTGMEARRTMSVS